jgi:hypothetical protein
MEEQQPDQEPSEEVTDTPEALPEGFATVAVETTGGVEKVMRVGYQLRHPEQSFDLGGTRVDTTTFTHKLAVRLRTEQPYWFRRQVIRGYYELNHPYWK